MNQHNQRPLLCNALKVPRFGLLVLIHNCLMPTNLITATLKYFSQSGKSAFITYASNPFSMDSACGYVSAQPILNLEPGNTFEMPANPIAKPMIDESGEPMLTKAGVQRMKLCW